MKFGHSLLAGRDSFICSSVTKFTLGGADLFAQGLLNQT